MRPAGATNFKWSMADIDRIARLDVSGLSVDKICSILAGTPLESTHEEIEDILRQDRISYNPTRVRL